MVKWLKCKVANTLGNELMIRGDPPNEWVPYADRRRCPNSGLGRVPIEICKKCSYCLGISEHTISGYEKTFFKPGPYKPTQKTYEAKEVRPSEEIKKLEYETLTPLPEKDGIHVITRGLPSEPTKIEYDKGELRIIGSGYELSIEIAPRWLLHIDESNPIREFYYHKGDLDVILQTKEGYEIEFREFVGSVREYLEKNKK